MKRIIAIALIALMVFAMAGCKAPDIKPMFLVGAVKGAAQVVEKVNVEQRDYFIAQVTEINDEHIIVKPYEGDWKIELPEEMMISLADLSYGSEMVGKRVFVKTSIRVYYEGEVIAHTIPTINATGIVFEEG